MRSQESLPEIGPERRPFRGKRYASAKQRTLWIAWLLLCLAPVSGGAAQDPCLPWQFPLAETEHVVSGWLAASGYAVARIPSDDGQVRLLGRKGGELWEVVLKPRSPLATCVLPSAAGDASSAPARDAKLRELLRRYSREAASDRALREGEIPPQILRGKSAVVCIQVQAPGMPLQLSGFALDDRGRILTTAHDLESAGRIAVLWSDGHKTAGRLFAVDLAKDLALIQTGVRPTSHVLLERARNLLQDGEPVFSVGCTGGSESRVYAGYVRTPMRRVPSGRLWEVDMETLPGASGGPVFDAVGNLVGVVKGRLRGTETTGFVIPVETVLEFLNHR